MFPYHCLHHCFLQRVDFNLFVNISVYISYFYECCRQIGKMLNAREPKIVNGPQILDKFVGESEANIRRLFADAEEEEKRVSVSRCGCCYNVFVCRR